MNNALWRKLIMSVRILYNDMKDAPVPLVADMYIKSIVASLDETSKQEYLDMIEPLKYDYKVTDTPDKCLFDDWRDIKNELYFTKGYNNIFKENQIAGLWVAYEALYRIFSKYPGPEFHAAYMQVFVYKRKKFWVTAEAGHVVFSTPDEY
jgi:hypothetical protein